MVLCDKIAAAVKTQHETAPENVTIISTTEGEMAKIAAGILASSGARRRLGIDRSIYSYTAGVKSESGISVQLKIIDLTASKGKQCQPLGLKTR